MTYLIICKFCNRNKYEKNQETTCNSQNKHGEEAEDQLRHDAEFGDDYS